MNGSRILVVDDDEAVRMLVRELLERTGAIVREAVNGREALRVLYDARPDLIVLDVSMPDMDGWQALERIRDMTEVPVLMLTARSGEMEKVRGLQAGADDYVLKPFPASQLDARIRAVLRRGASTGGGDTEVAVGGLRIDHRSRRATLDGADLELTPREFDLLHYLATRADEVVSKRELLTEVWQLPYGGADKTVDVHLSWLRRKLGETAQEPRYLHAVRGVGVRISAPGQ
jgi:DNA-binding response OmpR family regulator